MCVLGVYCKITHRQSQTTNFLLVVLLIVLSGGVEESSKEFLHPYPPQGTVVNHITAYLCKKYSDYRDRA